MTSTQYELRRAYQQIEQWQRTEQRDAIMVIAASFGVAALLVADFMLGFAFSDTLIEWTMVVMDWVWS